MNDITINGLNVKKVRAISIDCGNLAMKSKSDRGERHYLNTLNEDNGYGGVMIWDNDDKKAQTIYEYNGKRYYVGEMDMDSRYSLDANTSRYSTPDFKTMFVISVYQHIQNQGEHVRVVTGIPGKQYRGREEAQEQFNKLRGKHTVNNVTFYIDEIHVELQPLATAIYLGVNENGKQKEGGERFMDSLILVLDLGMGTTDVTILNKQRIMDVYELKHSMFNIYNRIIKNMQDLRGDDGKLTILASEHITAQEVEKQIRESLSSDTKRATYTATNGDEFDVDDIVKEAFQWGANDFIKELSSQKVIFEQFANVVLTGGGTQTLLPYLKDALSQFRGNSKVKFRIPDDVIKANARGYYIIGKNPDKFLNKPAAKSRV